MAFLDLFGVVTKGDYRELREEYYNYLDYGGRLERDIKTNKEKYQATLDKKNRDIEEMKRRYSQMGGLYTTGVSRVSGSYTGILGV